MTTDPIEFPRGFRLTDDYFEYAGHDLEPRLAITRERGADGQEICIC